MFQKMKNSNKLYVIFIDHLLNIEVSIIMA
jgi:hypothetical protein